MTVVRCTRPPTGATAKAAATHRASLPVLQTERLRLRAPTLHDYPAYARIMAADDGHMGGPFTAEDIWYDFANYVAGWLLHGTGLWSVETREGALTGFINLGLEWDDWEVELGWMILPEHRGQGYATEAAMAARDYGHGLLPDFVSYIDQTNTASMKVAARLGAMRDKAMEARIQDVDGDDTQVWRHPSEARP